LPQWPLGFVTPFASNRGQTVIKLDINKTGIKNREWSVPASCEAIWRKPRFPRCNLAPRSSTQPLCPKIKGGNSSLCGMTMCGAKKKGFPPWTWIGHIQVLWTLPGLGPLDVYLVQFSHSHFTCVSVYPSLMLTLTLLLKIHISLINN
jgi:hypothetical protein